MEAILSFIPVPVAVILMAAGFISLAVGGIRLGYKATVKDLALELVEKAELHTDAQRAFEKFHLVACLRAGVQVAEQAEAFLLHHHAHADALAEKLHGHIGACKKCLWSFGDAYPLQTRSAADVQIVGRACGGRVVVCRHCPILRQLRVELRRHRQDGQQRGERCQQSAICIVKFLQFSVIQNRT